jgi:hypothetical protein
MKQRTGDRPGNVFEPRVIDGHPTMTMELSQQPDEPHWRPWGVAWKAPKQESAVLYLCANCERLRTIMFLSTDRWLCTSCHNEGNQSPTFISIASAKG